MFWASVCSCSLQARLSVLSESSGSVLQRLGGGRRLVRRVRSGRSGFAGGPGPQSEAFGVCFLQRLAPRSDPRPASNAGADPAGAAAVDRHVSGETEAYPRHEDESSPGGLGFRHDRLNVPVKWS